MKKIRSRINKIAKISLAFLMACSALQMMNQSKEVHATTIQPRMMLWNDETKAYLNPPGYESGQDSWKGSKLYWGNNAGTPLLWRILGTNDTMFGTDSRVLIQGEDSLGEIKFRETRDNTYMGSTLATFIDTKFGDSLTTQEENATLDSAKTEQYNVSGLGHDYKDNFSEKEWFAPTAKMMSTPDYGYPGNEDGDDTRDFIAYSWLSSASTNYNANFAGYVDSVGDLRDTVPESTNQARAASSLNPDSILLVSNAEGGKSNGNNHSSN